MPTPQELLAQVAGTITAQTLETWNFGESVAFEGLLGASRVLADPSWEAFSWGYFRSWAASRTEFRELDCTFPGVAAVRIADARRDALLAEALTGLVDYLLARPKIQGIYRTWRHSPLMRPYGPAELTGREAAWVDDPPAGAFLDCLHFEPPLFAALGVLLGRDDLIRQAEEQTLAYIAALQQPDGLFHHFVLDGVEGSFGPGWGRGQGWALLGLLDVIEELQAVRPPNPDLLDAAQRLIGAMVSVQRPDGHWFAQVDVPTSGDEFSTAGFMAYGFSRAARLGIVDEREVSGAARAAHDAVVRGLGLDGVLGHVSAAVMACTEPTHYAHVPTGFNVPWGQGPALLALVENLEYGGE